MLQFRPSKPTVRVERTDSFLRIQSCVFTLGQPLRHLLVRLSRLCFVDCWIGEATRTKKAAMRRLCQTEATNMSPQAQISAAVSIRPVLLAQCVFSAQDHRCYCLLGTQQVRMLIYRCVLIIVLCSNGQSSPPAYTYISLGVGELLACGVDNTYQMHCWFVS